ncbi:GlxA family transcriptional regulator [Erythrobacter aureus]|uniref:GlxA family transcriptional regulator n=1 Tax=Erythrobacter aureus TaxID=2182384 RepID=UPI0013B3E2B6|nr:helix-turn-helix domain-containing protein [Erythrobacter aureus]
MTKAIKFYGAGSPTAELGILSSAFSTCNEVLARDFYQLTCSSHARRCSNRDHNGFGEDACSVDRIILDDIVIEDREIAQAALDRADGRLAGVHAGVFPIARMGLLEARRATVHWALRKEAETRFPSVAWTCEQIFHQDDNLFTCAGRLSALDLALHWVEADLGKEVALEVGRQLIIPFPRGERHPQQSRLLEGFFASSERTRSICSAIISRPDRDWSVTEMARQSAMTERTLHRRFRKEIGVTPAKFVELVRVLYAADMMGMDAGSPDCIAAKVGMHNAQTLRRALGRKPATVQA